MFQNFKIFYKCDSIINKLIIRNFYLTNILSLNCHRASITKVRRLIYMRQYPTRLIDNNGSSINIRYHVPRKIIKLPLDFSSLTDEQKRKRLESRRPKSKVVIEEDIDDTFDLKNYEHLWKK